MILQKNTNFLPRLFLFVSVFFSAVVMASERDKFVNEGNISRKFQKTVSSISTPVAFSLNRTIHIALIYPSADISDFWVKSYQAMVSRLEELHIPYVIDEFSTRQIEHALQSRYVKQVINSEEDYDFVIFGPSELTIQAENIQALSAENRFKTFIWAFHTPNPSWESKPDAWFDFSSSLGAIALCEFVIEELGKGIAFAMNRGIPGITDNQRSQDFSDCVESKGYWVKMYEHFGQYQKLGGIDGAHLIEKNFPEVTLLHNANTAMTMGAIEALTDPQTLMVTGWGGTEKEIEQIKADTLYATPMRMNDDLGVATAEAIKYYLEGRESEVPDIYLGRITIVNRTMLDEEIDDLSREAFRYSGKD
ncbi:substrate-binding domain-containing protein [Marinomonas sp. 15G1-11]|uniref:Substrate-binding domain-containing protein n=1 Tax=Marinomonas phaeophyticola TaxID=3004091 RepID=A0ABT4JW52_9GAMM|nr:substrate-binding domain-containing protein [Marinomonas sp. 15G1-11]MCZ2722569.1 substrate-binding domain-containing protein [Marinomonas sp. 15G1-11]